MYGFTRALLVMAPVAVVDVAVLNALDASRGVAIAVTTAVIAAGVLLGLVLEDRHGGLEPPR